MNIILLSGGSGKRLWPLSNDVRSKQFIKLFPTEDEEYESMVQRVYRQIRSVDKDAVVTVATSHAQIPSLNHQLGEQIRICAEPCRRDTFPAIALATAYLHDVQGVSPEEAVAVCPVDPYVEREYFETVEELVRLAQAGEAKLLLMGIAPDSPSEKYGYIIPADKERLSRVKSFQEKPDAETAKAYLKKGALWNGGVFAYRLGYVLEKAGELLGTADYYELHQKYETLTKISFDYAVVEKEKDIKVLRFAGQWEDLGTWRTFAEAMEEPSIGNATLNDTCSNAHVINELDVPILCMGLKDVVVAASPDGILVSDKEQADYIKPFVDKMERQVMFAEKEWGSFRVLDIEEESMTIKVTLHPGHGMHYHSHERRDEVWTILSGMGKTIVDGMEQPVGAGDVITVQAGCRHTILADTELTVMEVQLGKEISVHDKQKFELPQ